MSLRGIEQAIPFLRVPFSQFRLAGLTTHAVLFPDTPLLNAPSYTRWS
jgi:hypothetical protein